MQAQLKETKKIRHSVGTDDYIALDRIQNKNWQYLIESILKFVNLITVKIVRDSVENATIYKKRMKLYIIKSVEFKFNNQ